MAMIASATALGLCVLLGRLRYRRSMTCHFCKRYAGNRLPSALPGSWYCPFDDCGQYNGFTSNGDYDRSLPELDNPAYNFQFSRCHPGSFLTSPSILCSQCQCEQGLKIRALARSETASEAAAIENRYKICSNCKTAVSSRLKTVNRRIRCSYTPLGISNIVQESVNGMAKLPLFYIVIDLMLIWQALVPLSAMLQLDVAVPFSSVPFMASVSNHEYLIAIFKLFIVVVGSRRLVSYTLVSAIDVLIMLSLHGLLPNLVFVQLPTLGCHRSDSICIYRFWTVVIRCLGILCILLDFIKNYVDKKTVVVARRNPQACLFDAALTGSVMKSQKESNAKPSRQSLLSESGFKFSQDNLRNDLFAIEGARSCAVEDLFEKISISRTSDVLSTSSPLEDKQKASDSYLNISLIFIAAIFFFILQVKWSHWSISCLYISSLLVLLAVGRRRPLTLPFIILLLLRQCKSMSNIGSLVYDFITKFGLDLAGLGLLGLIFFIDWSAILEKLTPSKRNQTSSQEA